MDDILTRISRVEAILSDVRTDVASLKERVEHVALREDLSELKASLVQWAVGLALACGGLAFAAARFLS